SQKSDTGAHELLRNDAAERAASHQQHARGRQLRLTRRAELRQQNLSVVSIDRHTPSTARVHKAAEIFVHEGHEWTRRKTQIVGKHLLRLPSSFFVSFVSLYVPKHSSSRFNVTCCLAGSE